LIWSVWHLPYYKEFLPEEVITSVLPVRRIAFFLVGVFTTTVWTVMFVEIFRLTNSIWPAVLLHAVEDAVINPLIINGHISITSGMEIFISPICGIIPTALYLMIGLWLRGRRILNN
jgi:membrane protease YdiL (CAAX protease family)